MESVIASAIASLGTPLGSVATLAIQRGTAERGHRFTRDEKLRQERLDAYVAYAGALVDYRRCPIPLPRPDAHSGRGAGEGAGGAAGLVREVKGAL
ncbi:hypothetical protein [Streptomyces albidoflavus]|uniref:hypothetical protein n=1 Tax=Streptomyces albidoflavus TaxID=1886 RepID=UPI000318B2AB